MNKKLIAALLGVAFAGVAQAQSSNVVLYGIVDGGIRWDRTNAGTLMSVDGGGASGSRLGVRGTEDLGAGLKANFVLEQGVDISDSTVPQGDTAGITPTSPRSSTGGRFFGRVATVGLSGNFGNLRLGRDYSPHYSIWSAADPFGAGTVGTTNNIAVGSVTRFDNGIFYDTPSTLFAGFKGSLALRLGEPTTNNSAAVPTGSTVVTTPCTVAGVVTTCRVTNVDPATGLPTVANIPAAADNGGNALSLGLSFANGPLYVGYGFNYIRNAADTGRTHSHTLAATFDFKFAKAHGLYWRAKDNSPATATFTPADANSWALGVTVPFAGLNVMANYGRLDDRSANDFDARFWGLGATYAVSRRTDFYTAAGRMNNRGGAHYLISDASGAGLMTSSAASTPVPAVFAGNVPAGYSPTSFQIGVRHRF